jgi:hypothetical protein
VNSTTVWAPSTVTVKRSPDRIFSKVHLTYNEGTVTVSNATTATNYRTREVAVLDASITSSALATEKANALLDGAATEITEVQGLSVVMPALYVNDIRPGQRVEIKLTRHGVSSYTWYRVIRRTVTPFAGSDVVYTVTLGLASNVLAAATGGRGGDEIWPNKSNANDDGASVIIDRGGITVTDGALTITDEGGSTVMTGGGFSGTWLDYLQTGLYNGNWRKGPTTPASDITEGLGTSNSVPYWDFQQASGTAITARWTADNDSPVGGYMLLSMAAGAAGDDSYFEQYIPITPSKGRTLTIRPNATFVLNALGAGSLSDYYISGQFYKDDGTTTTGAASTNSNDLSRLDGLANDTETIAAAMATTPADAGFLRVRVGLKRDGAATSATASLRIYEVFITAGPEQIFITDVETPANTPGRIYNSDGTLAFDGLTRVEVSASDAVDLVASEIVVNGGLMAVLLEESFSTNQNDFDPETTFGQTVTLWSLENTAGASRNITGIGISQLDGWVRYLFNDSADSIVLVHESASSSAANRFTLPGAANYTITSQQGVTIFYLNTRWRVLDK